ncbi:hypothetical protein GCM10010104_70940 [Streptomyces indiaensis]|uniref:Uncharacterized protein n=1 Tax=Streptomyces indiaensis TaxID=284033 RepID=A0ABN3EMK0_9ACTN
MVLRVLGSGLGVCHDVSSLKRQVLVDRGVIALVLGEAPQKQASPVRHPRDEARLLGQVLALDGRYPA